MPASLIHFVLIHEGTATRPGQPRTLHFSLQNQAGNDSLARTAVDLLVVDARRMKDACQQAAFAEVARIRAQNGLRHGVLVCDVPKLPMVLGALRAGLRDIIHEPLTARRLVEILRTASPGQRVGSPQIAALAAILRTLAADRAPGPASTIARREFALEQRADKLAHMETRLSLERAALEQREQKLRTNARHLERQFAALQNDSDVPKPAPAATAGPSGSRPPFATGSTASPFSASPFVTDLQALAAQLSERAAALDIRERMLIEMERLLGSQPPAAAQREAPADPWPAGAFAG
jgi:DNA-binding NarL/FixJ family response regulator